MTTTIQQMSKRIRMVALSGKIAFTIGVIMFVFDHDISGFVMLVGLVTVVVAKVLKWSYKQLNPS